MSSVEETSQLPEVLRWTDCPKCGSANHHWAHRTPVSTLRFFLKLVGVLAEFVLGLLSLVVVVLFGVPLLFDRPITERRKCDECGKIFIAKLTSKPNFDVCLQCQYNLTGNRSGRCPECGWRLPRQYRAHRRTANKKATSDD